VSAHQPRRRPLPKGEAFFTPGATGMRRRIERRSAAPLVFLHDLPKWILPLVLLAALIVGFTVRGWIGGAALAAIAVFLGWFSYLSWPSLAASGRLLRGVVIAAVLALAIIQIAR
jgi:glycerol-3-phosphate acyltransferase PlsY